MKRIVVSGGTGYIGSVFVQRLVARGDDVTVLTRGESSPGNPRRVGWNPYEVGDWSDSLERADAVVHLAGERAVGVRYTAAAKRRIYDSRVLTTRNLVTAISRLRNKPSLLVSASAVGYYGNRPASERVDETASAGADFLARLCVDWEAESEKARDFGVRVVNPRIGIVFGPGDGPLKTMATPFQFFVGGKLGNGQQGMSWIHLDDAVRALMLCVDDDSMPPKVNICSPSPASNAEVSEALAKALRRPNWFTVPKVALAALFGEGAETILTGQYAVPGVLQKRDWRFGCSSLAEAIARDVAAG